MLQANDLYLRNFFKLEIVDVCWPALCIKLFGWLARPIN